MITTRRWPAIDGRIVVLTDTAQILSLTPLLQALAERTGQPGAMHWLNYFLDKAVAGCRVPYLVLVHREAQRESTVSAEDLQAAALFFQYRILGVSTGAFTTGDAVGFNSVIAPPAERTRVVGLALGALLQRGAKVALATYEGQKAAQPWEAIGGLTGIQTASRQRFVERSMKLGPTMEATLAQMGKHTRSNLRYYRRRLQQRMSLNFVAHAAPALAGADLAAINAASLNPVPAAEFSRRVGSATSLPGSYLCGLQGPDGNWLSLIGGWRQSGVTVLHWQMNTAGFEKDSIGTVMRSFFLEHEIVRGAKELMIHGGTPHSMAHSFETQPIADLIVRKRGLHSALLFGMAHLFANCRGLLRRPNFFLSTLVDKELEWVPRGSGKKVTRSLPGTTTAKATIAEAKTGKQIA